MFLQANQDSYGHPVNLTSNKLRNILELLDKYMDGKEYTICEIRQDNINDKNQRIDVEICYKTNFTIRQKLLILKGEVLDGNSFHKRYHEWYG